MKKVLAILIALCAVTAVPVAVGAAQPSSRIENAGSEPQAQGGKGTVTLIAGDEDATFRLYSVTGQLLRTVKVSAQGRVTIDMPKGFYLVKCAGHWSHKVVVK